MSFDDDIPQPTQPETCPNCHQPTRRTYPFCTRCKFDLRHGTLKKPVVGKCVYCKRWGKLSREHLFGDWLNDIYPRPSAVLTHTLVRPGRYVVNEETGQYASAKRTMGGPYTGIVWNVCAKCNNGWMSKLQKQAIPLITNLASGEWMNLSSQQCALVSRWVAMVTVNLQCYARMLNITQDQRDALMKGEMPAGWTVSIGRMVNAAAAGSHFYRACLLPNGLNIQSTYFCIERVAFYILNAIGDRSLGLAFICGVPDAHLPRRVWPKNDPPEQSENFLLSLPDLISIQSQFGPVGNHISVG